MATLKVGNQRLLKLATFLEEKIPKKNFNINNWYTNCDATTENLKLVANGQSVDCKTSGCAIGWTPAVFPRYFSWNEYGDVVIKSNGSQRVMCFSNCFFSLRDEDWECLFTMTGYKGGNPTPKTVAKHIRKFVEGRNS